MTGRCCCLDERVRGVLDQITVDEDGRSADVLGQRIVARSPLELRPRLADLLYVLFHAGSPPRDAVRARSLRDPELADRLAAALPHRHTVRAATILETVQDSGRDVVVRLDGVRVVVGVDAVDCLPKRSAGASVNVRINAQRPALSPGFFVADGSRGHGIVAGRPLCRLYVHLADTDAAVDVWSRATRTLEQLAVPYRVKVVSSPGGLPRHDAFVAYLGPAAWDGAQAVVAAVADVRGLGTATSLFTAVLAPGVGLGWEPRAGGSGGRTVSFGKHRSQAVADGVVDHACERLPGTRAEAVAAALRAAGVDPSSPHRNLTSPELSLRRTGRQVPILPWSVHD